jgi:hypothetical protein
VPDDFDGWVLDEEFVRAGRPEPPARTRAAIARMGGQRTSWRQPGDPAGHDLDRLSRRRRSGGLRRPSSRRARAKRYLMIGVLVLACAAFGMWVYATRGQSTMSNAGGPLAGASTIAAQPVPATIPAGVVDHQVRGIDPATPIGTCFVASSADAKPASTELVELTTVACSKAHMYELLAIERASDSATYPEQSYWRGSVAQACQRAFTEYTGVARVGSAASGRSSTFFKPLPVGWAQGDRTVYCVAHSITARLGSVHTPIR